MNEQERIDRTNLVKEVLGQNRTFSTEDLEVLRQNVGMYPYLSSNADPIRWRMDIELLDSIQTLNRTSTFLAKVGIVVASVGVLAALISLWRAFVR